MHKVFLKVLRGLKVLKVLLVVRELKVVFKDILVLREL